MTAAVTGAVYDALVAAGIAVYDHLPDALSLPCVTMGTCSERPWGAKTFSGKELRFILDGWSDSAGRLEIETLIAALRAALFDQVLQVAGWRVVLLAEDRVDILRETDGGMFHAVARFRLLMHETGL